MADPEIGWWAAQCCIEDLYEIDTPEVLAEVREALVEMAEPDYDGIPFKLWPSKEAALADPSIWNADGLSTVTAERLGLTPGQTAPQGTR